jgi:hypothetical protein
MVSLTRAVPTVLRVSQGSMVGTVLRCARGAAVHVDRTLPALQTTNLIQSSGR